MRAPVFLSVWLLAVLALATVLARGVAGEPSEGKPAGQTGDRADGRAAAEAGSKADGSQERIARLIRQLGDKDFEAREEAQEELAKLGFEAFDALRAATQDDDLEIASRARWLLRLVSVELARPGDPTEVARLLTGFHFVNQQEQISRMDRLAAMEGGRGIEALCRVARFEPSVVAAKHAAVAILQRYPSDRVPLDRLAKLLRDNLGQSQRTPSRWLLSYADFSDAPKKAWEQWEELTRREQALLADEDSSTNSRIVSALVTHQIDWVLKMGGTPQQMVEKIETMLQLRGRDPKNMKALVEWLVAEKAWETLGVSPSVLAGQLATDPRWLVYAVAMKYGAAGKEREAEAAAERAYRFEDDPPAQRKRLHFEIAGELKRAGRFAWAEREYRHVIRSGKLEDPYVLDAYSYLSEMLHDQGEDLRAADIMDELVKALKSLDKPTRMDGPTKSLMARMDYFLACDAKTSGDREKERLYLDAGLALDPTSVDLLIASYDLPGDDPVHRNKIRELVTKATLPLRVQVLTGDDQTNASNELAWLLANTAGDVDEAIQLARKAVRDMPDNGAYYDTLARCYFAKKDYEKAVQNQIKAAEFEPHSGLIAKQLELFRKTYEEKTGKPAPKPGPPKEPARGAQVPRSMSVDTFEFDAPVLPP